jgi:hypothetical protein
MRRLPTFDASAERKSQPPGRCVPLSTVVPGDLYDTVAKAAARELISVSAYTRRALQRCIQADERTAA